MNMNQQTTKTYASNTDGLPKTNFDMMRVIASQVVGVIVDAMPEDSTGVNLDPVSRSMAGNEFQGNCDTLEQSAADADFNVFSTKIENIMLINMCAVLLLAYEQRRMLRLSLENKSPPTKEALLKAINDLVDLAIKKDSEYGASWCKRGGIGAWFTTVRKFDRMRTQLANKEMDIWDVSDKEGTTESLEETILDAINYLLLILEKRHAIAKSSIDKGAEIFREEEKAPRPYRPDHEERGWQPN
jgi:hypothetical protein